MDLDNIIQLQEATAISFAQTPFSIQRRLRAVFAPRVLCGKIATAAWLCIWSRQRLFVLALKYSWLSICQHTNSGLRLLRRLWLARHLNDHPQEFVFCQIDRRFPGGKLIPSIPATGNAYRRLIKRIVHTIGLDTRRYSCHSLCSGGATDLFAKGTPYYVIKKMGGRRTSDAALLYLWSEMDVAEQAARAFGFYNTK